MAIEWSGAGLRPSSMSTEVAAYLEQLIVTGEIQVGEKVPPEREIAAKLGVSRSTVRQAMHELTLKGLTDRKPGRGTVVLGPGASVGSLLGALNQAEREPMQVTDLRQVVEPSVASRAALRATPADLRQLERACDEVREGISAAESVRLDEKFHLLVARATQNPLLVSMVEVMQDWLGELRRESHATASGRRSSHAGHRRILEAIRAGDPEAAEAAMHEHISGIGDLVAGRHTAVKGRG
ncbi:FadR/GntR family transcriptional regulator [Amycolatopsis jejuensis]|uniref:FadR/GntR family transcriptional regulator n=1 Tax=Amycolatopsis jejuensis TaxID=330084 RepID=UPI000A015284|nr:FadR/GntR family transcriptional regulator [Amycolatopsis jejuensis]